MEGGLHVRKFNEEDLGVCRELWADLTQWHRDIYDDQKIGGLNPGSHFDKILAQIGPESIWVVEVEGEVVGMAGLIKQGVEGELEPLIVRTDHRRKGIGKGLVEVVRTAAIRNGIKLLSVRPVARNEIAIRFFHGLGFDVLGHIEMFTDLGGTEGRWKGACTIAEKEFRL